MYVRDLLKLSTRSFRTNASRTWLTILGMGVGISAVVILVGLGFGLQQILLEQIIFGDSLLSLNVTSPNVRTLGLTPEVVEDLETIDRVDAVAPLASYSALMTVDELTGNVFLQGAEPQYLRFAGLPLVAGRVFREGAGTKELLLSQATLTLFDLGDDPEAALGRRVTMRALVPNASGSGTTEVPLQGEFEVVGVMSEEAAITAMLPLEELAANFAVNLYERVQVKVDSNESLDSVELSIIERGFLVSSLSKTVEQANQIFQGLQIMLAVFGSIALVVSSIGMFNTMTVTLLERTKEIGIMRTIGAAPVDIFILFLVESTIIAFLGGIIGIAIGVIVGVILNLTLNALATQFGGVAVSLFAYPLWFILFIAGFSAVVGFLTGIFPSRRASRINPLDAIRYE